MEPLTVTRPEPQAGARDTAKQKGQALKDDQDGTGFWGLLRQKTEGQQAGKTERGDKKDEAPGQEKGDILSGNWLAGFLIQADPDMALMDPAALSSAPAGGQDGLPLDLSLGWRDEAAFESFSAPEAEGLKIPTDSAGLALPEAFPEEGAAKILQQKTLAVQELAEPETEAGNGDTKDDFSAQLSFPGQETERMGNHDGSLEISEISQGEQGAEQQDFRNPLQNQGEKDGAYIQMAGTLPKEVSSYGRQESAAGAGENQISLGAARESLPEDLGDLLFARLTGKPQTLELALEPESLGRLTIRASYENGKAHISIMASDPETLEILRQRASDLAGILEDHTGQPTVIDIPDSGGSSGWETERESRERQDEQEQRRRQKPSDSFAQQLRLGLV